MSTIIVTAKKSARLIKNVREIYKDGAPSRVTVTYQQSVTADLLAFLEGGTTIPMQMPASITRYPRTPARPEHFQEAS